MGKICLEITFVCSMGKTCLEITFMTLITALYLS